MSNTKRWANCKGKFLTKLIKLYQHLFLLKVCFPWPALNVAFSRDLRVTSLLKIFQTIVSRQKLRFDGYIDYIVVTSIQSVRMKKSGSGIEWSGTFHLNQPGTPIGWIMWKGRKKYTTHPIKYLRLDNPITSLLINKWDHQAISSVNWLFKTCLALWLCRCFQHTRRISELFQ